MWSLHCLWDIFGIQGNSNSDLTCVPSPSFLPLFVLLQSVLLWGTAESNYTAKSWYSKFISGKKVEPFHSFERWVFPTYEDEITNEYICESDLHYIPPQTFLEGLPWNFPWCNNWESWYTKTTRYKRG